MIADGIVVNDIAANVIVGLARYSMPRL